MRLKHPSGPQRLRKTTFEGRRSKYSLTTLFFPQAVIAPPSSPPPPHLVSLAGKKRTPNGHPAFSALWNMLPGRSVWVLPQRNYLREWQGSTIRDQIDTGCQACRDLLAALCEPCSHLTCAGADIPASGFAGGPIWPGNTVVWPFCLT